MTIRSNYSMEKAMTKEQVTGKIMAMAEEDKIANIVANLRMWAKDNLVYAPSDHLGTLAADLIERLKSEHDAALADAEQAKRDNAELASRAWNATASEARLREALEQISDQAPAEKPDVREWLARNIAHRQHVHWMGRAFDRDALSDDAWGRFVDEAEQWLSQPDAPGKAVLEDPSSSKAPSSHSDASSEAASHKWHMWHGLECCQVCGIVRRADDGNKPCRGPVRVGVREDATEAAPPPPEGGQEP